MEKEGIIKSSIVLLNSRKDIIFAVTYTAALSSIIAGKGFPPITESFLAIMAVAMIVSSVYIYNDLQDRDMDAHSEQDKKKGRPIAHGKVSIKNAKIFVLITGILGLSISILLGPTTFIIGFSYYTIIFLYSHPKVRFKEMFIIKNLVSSLLMPVAFLLSGAAIEQKISLNMSFLAITYYTLTVLLLPSIADMLDYQEDLDFNVRTIGNSLTWKQNLILYNIGIIVLIVGNIVSYLMFGINLFVPVLTSALGFMLMAYSFKLRNDPGQDASYKLRPVSYALILLNPLTIAIGTLI
jgi:4-hydroxybenzoate polyprenyltransferase